MPSLFNQALKLVDERRAAEAEALLMSVSEEGRDAEYYESLSYLLLHRMQYSLASEAASRALSMGRDTQTVRTVFAQARTHTGARIKEDAGAGPGSIKDQYFRAGLAYRNGDYGRSANLTRDILKQEPDFVAAQCLLLACSAAQGDDQARLALEERWENEREPSAVLYLMADAELRGEPETVRRYAPDVLVLNDLDVNLVSSLTRLFVLAGQPQAALDILDSLDASSTAHSRIDAVRGDAHLMLGRIDDALIYLKRAFEAEPSGGREANRYIQTLFRTGKWVAGAKVARRHFLALKRQRHT